jgi:predicted nucleotidyltransferase
MGMLYRVPDGCSLLVRLWWRRSSRNESMKKEDIIKILKETKDDARQNYKAEIKGIFGSYARGEEKSSSDVDILVMFFEGATLFNFVGLADFLEEKLNARVDIVPIDTVRTEIKKQVLKEAIYI